MGVPALFRWLTRKYPKITTPAVEEQCLEVNGLNLPIDMNKPNPNSFETDNLYLDMNGIIHPCCHPEGRPAPSSEDAMMAEIFKYIDRIMLMVRPRKVLYMAIDGVAPRAKMNQQRSRRFRAAAEADAKEASEADVRRKYEEEHGLTLPPQLESFDSNCITPGTPFMTRLAECLRYYVARKFTEDAGWAKIKVIISDASVPGEGEHKIMDYIRRQRALRDFDPNTSHVLHGLDADLIMLALATHEPHFKILREDVFFKEGARAACFTCGQTGHNASECRGQPKEKTGQFGEQDPGILDKPHLFLHLNVLREYLEAELQIFDLGFPWSLERAIDDWIFLIFFVGNDFLPHLPSLDIKEDAIDRLVDLWKKELPTLGDWLTDSGSIDLRRCEVIMRGLAEVEDDIFRNRRQKEEKRMENNRRRKEQQQNRGNYGTHSQQQRQYNEVPEIVTATAGKEVYAYPNRPNDANYIRDRLKAIEAEKTLSEKAQTEAQDAKRRIANKAAADALKASLKAAPAFVPHDVKPNVADINVFDVKPDVNGINLSLNNGATNTDVKPNIQDVPLDGVVQIGVKRKADQLEEEELESGFVGQGQAFAPAAATAPDVEEEDDANVVDTNVVTDIPPKLLQKVVDDDEEPPDIVRLWEPGWKQRYYRSKFGVEPDDEEFRRNIATKYVEGLCWVLKYYYQGVQSWKWFYPFYYSPFASDFVGISALNITFELGVPFRPFEQLMAVFPARSRKHIPEVFHPLMLSQDSPIYDFYPEKFEIDLDGKKYAWQGVAKLTWVDEARLLEAMMPLYHNLTAEETIRNSIGYELLCIGAFNDLFEPLCKLYGKTRSPEPLVIDPRMSEKMQGSVLADPDVIPPGGTYPSPLTSQGLEDVQDLRALSALYFMPKFPEGYMFKSELKMNVQFPPKVLSLEDMQWIANKSSGGGRNNRRGPYIQRDVANRFVAANTPASPYGSPYGSQPSQYRGGAGTPTPQPTFNQSYDRRTDSGYDSRRDERREVGGASNYNGGGGRSSGYDGRNGYDQRGQQQQQQGQYGDQRRYDDRRGRYDDRRSDYRSDNRSDNRQGGYDSSRQSYPPQQPVNAYGARPPSQYGSGYTPFNPTPMTYQPQPHGAAPSPYSGTPQVQVSSYTGLPVVQAAPLPYNVAPQQYNNGYPTPPNPNMYTGYPQQNQQQPLAPGAGYIPSVGRGAPPPPNVAWNRNVQNGQNSYGGQR
ncbi:hypothetical protein SmJEL517_g01499 [Synchytrium microbalum]|uniref:5'-3' exoribonuclease n=1 Tax=Synchytrium microbalum TaxID=1806994 RepID=A0A507CE40_9FUNG|nr:uncharacterized protein SmJEL517_g01499 [Synchytrium microbalum]TPX36194.1 hypothetical protein SmJEL517_g01499 [Synchytrium microbalum]